MRKTLDFCTSNWGVHPEYDKLVLDLGPMKEIIELVYRKRGEYFKHIGRDPQGVVLPARVYLSFQNFHPELMDCLNIDRERRTTLFGLELYPSGGTEISFVPQEGDVPFLALIERGEV